jgi:hypothetical protein
MSKQGHSNTNDDVDMPVFKKPLTEFWDALKTCGQVGIPKSDVARGIPEGFYDSLTDGFCLAVVAG